MFVMAAFTGLAFIDISNLKREHVVEDNDGNMWIRKPRQKTDIVTMPSRCASRRLCHFYDV